MFLGVRSRPIRTTLRWQLIVSAALAVAGGFIWGLHGAASAAFGGLVNVVAGWAYGWLIARRTRQSAGQALATMFRAEAVKVVLIMALLWLLITNYKDMVVASFLIAFVITVLVSATAIVVKDA